MKPTHKTPRSWRGQALAEFSLVIPILLLVVLGIIDIARVLFVFSDSATALRNAARNAEILGFNSGTPTYADCGLIEDLARSARFLRIDNVEIYYWDTTDPDVSLTAFPANWDTMTLAQQLATAHYTCNGTGGLPVVNSSDMDNGDMMRVYLDGYIGFMTPFLNSIWGGIDVDLYAQRSVITQLTLGSSSGIDNDFDGLDDRWEFMWFGCVDQTDDTKIWNVVNTYWFEEIVPAASIEGWTVTDGTTTSDWMTVCETISVDDDDDDTTPDILIPKEINTEYTNAIADLDADGCNNGCEEVRNAQPEDYGNNSLLNAAGPDMGADTDGDGLTDGQEASLYFTDPTGADVLYCDLVSGVPTPVSGSDGIPDGYDSDCDFVPDGVEVNLSIQPNNPGMLYTWEFLDSGGNEVIATQNGYPFRTTEARGIDLNPTDGIFDGIDSDGDGLYDYQEYYDTDPCNDGAVVDATGRVATATPYMCHANIAAHPNLALFQANLAVSYNDYFTNPTDEDFINPGDGIDGLDTDRDGLGDKEEIDGVTHAVPFFINDDVAQECAILSPG